MGYHYRESGYGQVDYLVVTKTGIKEGGLPKGIVFLAGLPHVDKDFMNWLERERYEGKEYYIFPAKHCDDENELTHISKNGFVNRFGYFVTKKDMFATSQTDCIDIKNNWFTRKHVGCFTDALKTLDL